MNESELTAFRAAQIDFKEKLMARAADRPAHARYLDILLAADANAHLSEIPMPKGVSTRVAEALDEDVEWIRADRFPGWRFPGAYAERRRKDARPPRKSTGGLEALLK